MRRIKNTGLYIHFPFCTRKCFYCDFYSITDLSQTEKFLEYLAREIEIFFNKYRNMQFHIDTLFLGGGTPSLLKPEQLGLILNNIKKHVELNDGAEITVECNPGTKISEYMKEYKELGINRLSIGVQSFNDDELKFLQRIHDSETAIETIKAARLAGFDNINIDLIFSLPGQSKEKLSRSLDKALELDIDHISAYSLIYEEGTPLHRGWSHGLIKKNEDEYESEFYYYLIHELAKRGFEQYEVSNFAKPGKKCRHNLNYWNSGEYISFGPSAHGFLDGKRYGNVRSLNKYYDVLDKNELPRDFEEILSKKEELTENIFLSLRAEGVNVTEFNNKFNTDLLTDCRAELDEFAKSGLLVDNNEKIIKLTPRGYALCDSVCIKLIEVMEKALRL
jgi:oxygen-independent coproporphyrinogen III oxidase